MSTDPNLIREFKGLQQQFKDHKHTGLDSQLVAFTLENQGSITTENSDTTSDTTYSATEKAVIDNNRDRINDIEDALKALGVLT